MLITTQQELDRFCIHLAKEKVIAVDTEFIREKSYYPILSLIQIATSQQVCAIDVLTSLDLGNILSVLVDRTILKIFHAAKQDVEVIYNHFKKVPINIFDTQIAAQFAGFNNPPSYEKLVETYCGVSISKQYQFSDWQSRPLSKNQIEYALGDVAYLIKIKDLLTSEIEAKNLLDWVNEENKTLENYVYKAPQAIDHLGKFLNSFKNIQSLSRVYVLLKAREKQAENLNKPRNFISKDEAITDAVKRGQINQYLCNKLGITYEDLLKEAENPSIHQIIKEFIKKSIKPIEIDNILYQELKNLLADKAAHFGISASLIANRNDLNLLVIDKAKDCKIVSGWRKLAFGQEALLLRASYGDCKA